jgi:methanogenic corrinoid protein MtbC1
MYRLGKEASDYIIDNIEKLTEAVIRCHEKVQPDLQKRYGESGYSYYCRDIKHHFKFLSSALTYLSKGLFNSYIEWVKGLMVDLNVPLEDVVINFQCFKKIFENQTPANIRNILIDFMEAGLNQIGEDVSEIPSFIDKKLPLSDLASKYLELLLQGDQKTAKQLILDAVRNGTDVRDIYLQVLEKVQLEIGRLWQTNQLTVAQEHYCTKVTELVMSQLSPYVEKSIKTDQTLVATCVAGELHDIGIRMVSDFFELSGWKTYLIGANTPTPSILQTLKKQEPDLLAISVTIPLYVSEAEKVIQGVKTKNATKDVKIIVGGRAFMLDKDLWKKIGADGFASDARSAVKLAKKLFKMKND